MKDPRFERLACMHKGTYADDCIIQRYVIVVVLLYIKTKNHPTKCLILPVSLNALHYSEYLNMVVALAC